MRARLGFPLRLQALLQAALLASAFGLGCGPMDAEDNPDNMGNGKGPPLPLGMPVEAKPSEWTWVDFPDAVCDDGSATGIAVNPAPGSKKLLVFLMGGGACWDYLSCAVLNSSTHGPMASKQWDSVKAALGGSILDRGTAQPFADYNLVWVPYCTGDVHSGDNVATYTSGMQQKVIHHKGRANLMAFMKRLGATFGDSEKIVFSGSSAGGFGVAINYDLVRPYFPKAKGYMLDDSGPILVGEDVPQNLRQAWIKNWGLESRLAERCPECAMDLSAMLKHHASDFPQDRMALLSYTQDQVIRTFLGLRGAKAYEQNLATLATTIYDALPGAHYYYVAGQDHTFLLNPGKTTAQGIPLLGWLAAFESDDSAWMSTKP